MMYPEKAGREHISKKTVTVGCNGYEISIFKLCIPIERPEHVQQFKRLRALVVLVPIFIRNV